ncbi:MAG TPA: PKD domain-containing protein, partial [Thermoplasmata archaeon]|nr:PKD domain-containing protein [Thermoplasmata archaeon]
MTLFIPYNVGAGQIYPQVAVGENVTGTVSVASNSAIKTYTIYWGVGALTTGPNGTQTHSYREPGLYAVYATATDRNGDLLANTAQLVPLQVNPSAGSASSGEFPQVALSLKNSSGGHNPWVGAGASVTVNGSFATRPANFLYAPAAPTLVSSGGTQSALSSGPTWVQASYTFPNPGYFGITMVVTSLNATTTVYQNFTWGIYVAPSAAGLGCAECSLPGEVSPHKNLFVNYEDSGGALDLDPAADYYSVGYEVGQGFDESLITFNGTDSGQSPANFVPEVATCVPGSPLCTKLYGNTLVSGSNYTFVIDKAAHFWDPYTSVGREV